MSDRWHVMGLGIAACLDHKCKLNNQIIYSYNTFSHEYVLTVFPHIFVLCKHIYGNSREICNLELNFTGSSSVTNFFETRISSTVNFRERSGMAWRREKAVRGSFIKNRGLGRTSWSLESYCPIRRGMYSSYLNAHIPKSHCQTPV